MMSAVQRCQEKGKDTEKRQEKENPQIKRRSSQQRVPFLFFLLFFYVPLELRTTPILKHCVKGTVNKNRMR